MPTNSLDSALDAISSITQKHFLTTLADNINTSNVALMKLKKETVSGGTDIRQPIRYARGVQENYTGSQTLNTSYVDKKFAAIFTWKQKNFPIVISGLDELKNNGADKIIDHLDSETKAAEEDAMDSFGTAIYSAGTDSLEVVGVRTLLSTSNTYGGISQSSNSWWQAQIDSTTTALSLSTMNALYEACREGNDAPGLITTTETQFAKVWGFFQPQQRFADSETAKAGFKNIMFNGAIVSEDSYCPSGYLIMWNLDRIKLVSSTIRNFPGKFIPFQKPVDQDAMVAHIRWAGNMVCEQPRKLGAMTALA